MKAHSKVLWGTMILALLIPAVGIAQFQNVMGIYTEEMDISVESDNLVTNTLFIVISNPYNVDEDRPVDWIHGYECNIQIQGTGLMLAVRWPVEALNVGDNLNHIVAYGSVDVPVVDSAATVAEIDIIYMDGDGGPLTLTMQPPVPASIPGYMAYLDGASEAHQLQPLTPSSGDWAYPVFGINVFSPIHPTSFDNLKALYR